MKKNIIYLVTLLFVFSSCSNYQKLLKSSDNELKYEKAKEYHAKKDYLRAATLLEDVVTYYSGTQEAGNIIYLLGDCYYNNKSYLTAANYYTSYNRNHTRGEHAIECRYMVGHCYYKMSPEAKLDQDATYKAIEAFNVFLELYPYSERAALAIDQMQEMQEKLVYKQLLNAQLYYKLGNYQGNNYQSAIITAGNALKNSPETKYREELTFLVLRSKYMQAHKSIESKKEDRYREAIDEYYVYSSEFPQGKYIKDAEKMLIEATKYIER